MLAAFLRFSREKYLGNGGREEISSLSVRCLFILKESRQK
jgi:hypothetical protein